MVIVLGVPSAALQVALRLNGDRGSLRAKKSAGSNVTGKSPALLLAVDAPAEYFAKKVGASGFVTTLVAGQQSTQQSFCSGALQSIRLVQHRLAISR